MLQYFRDLFSGSDDAETRIDSLQQQLDVANGNLTSAAKLIEVQNKKIADIDELAKLSQAKYDSLTKAHQQLIASHNAHLDSCVLLLTRIAVRWGIFHNYWTEIGPKKDPCVIRQVQETCSILKEINEKFPGVRGAVENPADYQ